MQYAYITRNIFPGGEFTVSAYNSNGDLLFGFRSRDEFGWRNKASSWAAPKYIPVFQANKPAKVIS